MTNGMWMDPAEVARLARSYLDTSRALFGDSRDLRTGGQLSLEQFGNVKPAGELLSAYQNVFDLSGSALERLVAVLEEGSDQLYRTAFHFEKVERDIRDRQFRRNT